MNPLTKIRSGAASAGKKVKGAGSTAAAKAKGAGRAVGEKTKKARGAVTARTSPAWSRVTGLWAQAKERFQTNPQMGIAAILGALLLIAWIAWAIYVTSTNGANAGLGVVISWPAVLMALALIMAPFVGLYLLVRRLQGGDPADPPIAGGAPDDDETSATAGTYPG